jgi:predicted RND superfamily exporter protein
MNNSFTKGLEFCLNSRKVLFVTIGLFVIFAIFSSYQVQKIKTHYSLKQFQPNNHPAIAQADKVRNNYLISEMSPFIIALEAIGNRRWDSDESLDLLSNFLEDIEMKDSVENVESLNSIPIAVVKEDVFSIGTLKEVAEPRNSTQNSLLSPHLISHNGKHTAILVTPYSANSQEKIELNNDIERQLTALPHDVNATLGGPSAIMARMTLLLNKELTLFTALALALTALMLFVLFKGVLAPLMCVGLVCISILMSVAAMVTLDMPFTVLSNTVPILIAITVIAMVSHSLIRLNKEIGSATLGKLELVKEVFGHLIGPHMLTALTTAIGFGTLIPSEVPVIRGFGVSVVVSILLTCAVCLSSLPLLLFWLPVPQRRFSSLNFTYFYSYVGIYKKPIVVSFVLLLLTLGTSMKQLNWSSLLMDDLPNGDSTKTANLFIDSHLGGTLPLDLNIEAKQGEQFWKHPENLERLETLTLAFRQLESVGSVMSVTDFLKTSEVDGKVPGTSQRIAEKYLLYGMNEDNPLEAFLTPNKNSTRVALRMRDVPSEEMLTAVGRMEKLAHRLFPAAEVIVTGAAKTTHEINREVSQRLMFGFFVALFWIFLLLAFVFRSFSWAIVSVVPNLMPPTILITALALSETPIKPGIAIIFSISLGIAFDNTVYLLNSLKRQLRTNVGMALKAAMIEEAEACLLSGVCLMAGFSVFVFSHFAMNQVFGLFMLLSISSGLVGDLILLPAFVSLFPRLLLGKGPVKKAQSQTGEGLPYAA